MRNSLFIAAGVVVLGLAVPVAAEQATLAGRVKTVSGDAFIVHAGETIPATSRAMRCRRRWSSRGRC